jgi:proton-dependent oligopeptide transporter, POT family
MTAAATVTASPTSPQNERFGHPRGLWVLAGTELWDRISFHGMQAMLVLYMAGELLKPGRIERVIGFDAYRGFIEGMTGPLSSQAMATQTFGFYMALIGFMPLIGGAIGDRWISRRAAVTIGALLMTCGHFSLAFDETFLLALVLLVTGAGMLRGNLKAQIRALYAAGDRRQADAFQVYSFVVNFGAFIAPIVSGGVAAIYGWHAGFAVAGFGMLIGLVWYLAGSRHLPRELEKRQASAKEKLNSAQRKNLWLLALMWPISVAFWTAQAQIWNVYNIWVRDTIDLSIGSFTMPVPWLQSLDGLAPAAFIPLVIWIWRAQAKRGTEPDLFVKMGIGCLIFAAGVALLALSPLFANSAGRSPLAVPVLFHLVSNFGAIYFSPVMLTLFASRAPARLRGTMLGVDALSISAASLISGYMGGLYETMDPSTFWSINAVIVGSAGVLLVVGSRPLRSFFGPEGQGADPLEEDVTLPEAKPALA